jgi:hypothetical protein
VPLPMLGLSAGKGLKGDAEASPYRSVEATESALELLPSIALSSARPRSFYCGGTREGMTLDLDYFNETANEVGAELIRTRASALMVATRPMIRPKRAAHECGCFLRAWTQFPASGLRGVPLLHFDSGRL